MISEAAEQIMLSLSEHAGGTMQPVVRAAFQEMQDTHGFSDLTWAVMKKSDVEGFAEAMYGLMTRFEEILTMEEDR